MTDAVALVWDGRFEHRDVSVEPPRVGEVRVRGIAAGLCRSDLNVVKGTVPYPFPVVLGHELVAEVEARGPEVTGLSVGDVVVVTTLAPCRRCRRCRAGRPTLCKATAPCHRAPFRDDHGRSVYQFYNVGAFATRTVVQATQAIPIEGLSPEAAAILGCAVLTGTGAARHAAGVAPHDSVVVVGAGGIGLNAIQGASLAGAERILGCDARDRQAGLAKRLGATHFVQTRTAGDLEAAIYEFAEEGPDATIECTGVPALLEVAVATLGWGGTAVSVGLPAGQVPITLPVRSLSYDRVVTGCRMGGGDPALDIPWMVEQYRHGNLILDDQVSQVVPLEEATELFAALDSGDVDRGVVWLSN